MLSKLSILSLSAVLFVGLAVGLAGCQSDDLPDARIPQANLPDASVSTVDAPASSPDATPANPDAAPGNPDAAPSNPDAAPGTPDAAPGPDAMPVENPATVILNEVAPNGADDQDYVELLVVTAGNTSGIRLIQNYTASVRVLATLPDAEVAAGDLIVVHLQAGEETVTETTSRAQCQAAEPSCFGQAWDVAGESPQAANIGYSYRVLLVRAQDDTVTDAASFMRFPPFSGTPPGNFAADLGAIITDGHWDSACAAPCDTANIANMRAASVNWSDAGNSATGATSQRKAGGADTDTLGDWSATPVAGTLGAPNTTN